MLFHVFSSSIIDCIFSNLYFRCTFFNIYRKNIKKVLIDKFLFRKECIFWNVETRSGTPRLRLEAPSLTSYGPTCSNKLKTLLGCKLPPLKLQIVCKPYPCRLRGGELQCQRWKITALEVIICSFRGGNL